MTRCLCECRRTDRHAVMAGGPGQRQPWEGPVHRRRSQSHATRGARLCADTVAQRVRLSAAHNMHHTMTPEAMPGMQPTTLQPLHTHPTTNTHNTSGTHLRPLVIAEASAEVTPTWTANAIAHGVGGGAPATCFLRTPPWPAHLHPAARRLWEVTQSWWNRNPTTAGEMAATTSAAPAGVVTYPAEA